jgi:hypothetical protein
VRLTPFRALAGSGGRPVRFLDLLDLVVLVTARPHASSHFLHMILIAISLDQQDGRGYICT